jgi:hypothetical protein
MHRRPLYMETWRQLATDKAMVFLSGPRQSGKTTLARTIAGEFTNHLNFNWDLDKDKTLLLKNPTFFQELNRKNASSPLVILMKYINTGDGKITSKGSMIPSLKSTAFSFWGAGDWMCIKKGEIHWPEDTSNSSFGPSRWRNLAHSDFPLKRFTKTPFRCLPSLPP